MWRSVDGNPQFFRLPWFFIAFFGFSNMNTWQHMGKPPKRTKVSLVKYQWKYSVRMPSTDGSSHCKKYGRLTIPPRAHCHQHFSVRLKITRKEDIPWLWQQERQRTCESSFPANFGKWCSICSRIDHSKKSDYFRIPFSLGSATTIDIIFWHLFCCPCFTAHETCMFKLM